MPHGTLGSESPVKTQSLAILKKPSGHFVMICVSLHFVQYTHTTDYDGQWAQLLQIKECIWNWHCLYLENKGNIECPHLVVPFGTFLDTFFTKLKETSLEVDFFTSILKYLFPDKYFTVPSLQREPWQNVRQMENQNDSKFKTFQFFLKLHLVKTKIFSYRNPLGDV